MTGGSGDAGTSRPRAARDAALSTDHLMPTMSGRTVRGGAVTIVAHGFKVAMSIGATAVLARLLNPSDYGLVGMVAIVTLFASLFKDMGLSLATVQRPEITHRQVTNLFWVNVVVSLATTIVIIALAPGISWFYGEPRLTAIAIATASGFMLSGLSAQHEALLKRQMRFVALSTVSVTSMAVGYSVGVAMAVMGAGYWAIVCSQLALLTTNVIGVWLASGWRPGLPTRGSEVRSMLTFGRNVTGYGVINYFSGNMDSLLIGRVCGPEQLGFYSRAGQIASLPTDQLSEPIGAVMVPALSRLSRDPERYRQAYFRIMQKIMMLSMPCVGFMIASSDWLVYLVLGPKWHTASRIFALMAIPYLLQPLSTGGWLMVTQGRTREMVQWSLTTGPVSILCIVLGLPWGAVGVATSFAVGRMCLLFPFTYWFVGRTGPVRTRDFYRLALPFTLASVSGMAMCLGYRALAHPTNPLIGCVTNLIIAGTTSVAVMYAIPASRLALHDAWRSVLLLLRAQAKPLSAVSSLVPETAGK